MGIILSLVIALRLVSVNTFVPDIVLQQEQGIKFIGWAVVGIYALSAAYLLLMLIRQLVNVFIMWRNSWNIREGNYLLCILKDIVTSPSTFFRMVFISWGDFFDPESREERDMLLAHEEYHVRNLHSIDVLILTIMRFFCWFNPVFRKYAKELKQVNEYAADRSVVRGVGIRPYIRAFTDINTRQFEANEMLSYSSAVTGHRKRYDMIRRHGEDTSGSLLKLVCILPVFMLLLYLSPEFVVKYCSLPEVIINLF